MTGAEARKILGKTIQPDDSLDATGQYISWEPGDEFVTIDGGFELDYLEAVCWWVRNKGK